MSTQGESYASKDNASVSFSVIVVVPSGSDQLLTAGWGSHPAKRLRVGETQRATCRVIGEPARPHAAGCPTHQLQFRAGADLWTCRCTRR